MRFKSFVGGQPGALGDELGIIVRDDRLCGTEAEEVAVETKVLLHLVKELEGSADVNKVLGM